MAPFNDPYDLNRFVRAQATDYERALSELRDGKKQSHWMWYIFPQIEGLGHSPMSIRYSIKSAAEARAYLDHPVLSPRLRECAAVVGDVAGRSALEIFGSPDDMKLRSCATLFAIVSDDGIFELLLQKYFDGQNDKETVRRLEALWRFFRKGGNAIHYRRVAAQGTVPRLPVSIVGTHR